MLANLKWKIELWKNGRIKWDIGREELSRASFFFII